MLDAIHHDDKEGFETTVRPLPGSVACYCAAILRAFTFIPGVQRRFELRDDAPGYIASLAQEGASAVALPFHLGRHNREQLFQDIIRVLMDLNLTLPPHAGIPNEAITYEEGDNETGGVERAITLGEQQDFVEGI